MTTYSIGLSDSLPFKVGIPFKIYAAMSTPNGMGIPLGVSTLSWSIYYPPSSGYANSAIFLATSGLVTIINGVGYFYITILATPNGPVNFQINLGGGVAFSYTTQVYFPPTLSYKLTPTTTSVNEGVPLEFIISTTLVPDGTVLYWDILNKTTTNSRFSITSGSAKITNNSAFFSITPIADKITEGQTTFDVNLRTINAIGSIVTTAGIITINDTSNSYTLTPSTNIVIEGDSVTFNITSKNVVDGTILYWSTATNSRIPVNSGTVTILNNIGSFVLNTTSDLVWESVTPIIVNLETDNTTGSIVVSSTTTLLNLPSTYTLTPITTSVNEGGVLTVNVSGTNIQSGAILYWSIANGTTTNSRFAAAAGVVSITNNSGVISIYPLADKLTEGPTTFSVNLQVGSSAGTIKANSGTITINDTSTLPPTYNLTPAANNVDEGSTLLINVKTTNVPNGTILYWTLTNTKIGFTTISGLITINNNIGSFSVSPIADHLTEGPTTFIAYITTEANIYVSIANSQVITVNDTSTSPPTYILTPTALSVNEGNSLVYNIKTTNVPNGTILYWDIVNKTTTNSRFSIISGSTTINNNIGSFSINPIADKITEGATTFDVNLRAISSTGAITTTAGIVTINDTSTSPPTYALTPIATSINEGSILTLNVKTTDIPNGTILYWSIINGTTTNSRFSVVSGSTTITNNTGTFSINPIADKITEGATNFTVKLMTGSISGVIVTTSGMITVNDTSTTPPTYKIIPTANNVNEGSSLSYNITTTNIKDGTVLYWSILNITTANARFSSFFGTATITNNTGTFSISTIADKITEGATTFNVNLMAVSATSPIVATAGIVTINDTSTTPPTYILTPTATSINEGSPLTLNIKTTDVPNGTVLYWDILNKTTTNSRFSTTSGSATITGNASSFSISPIADNLTEGTTLFDVNLRAISATGTIVTTAGTIIINDTSTSPPTYILTPTATSINEGSILTLNIKTTDVPNGTVLYWDILNKTTTNSRFSVFLGSAIVSNNIASFDINPIADNLTEGTTLFDVNLRAISVSGVIVATSGNITINDTSTTPTYSLIPVTNNVNEGSSLTLNITTTNISNGTMLYWDILNVTTTNDRFNVVSGSATISTNVAKFTINLIADNLTEGPTTFNVNLRTLNAAGTIVTTAGVITINDTSISPTYSLVPVANNVDEGSSLLYTITTTNVPNETILYWSILNITTIDSRFSITNGSTKISNNVGTFSINPIADKITEGPTTFNVNLSTVSIFGTIVATAEIVTINDTSTTPPTYLLSPATSSVNEGSSLTMNIVTTLVPDGTVLYWNTFNITTTNSRFSSISGSAIVTGNIASFSINPIADNLTEGVTFFNVNLLTGSNSGIIVATSGTITLNDTSLTPPPTYSLVPAANNVDEGNLLLYTIITTNVPDGTVLYWSILNITTTNSRFSAISSPVTIKGNSGTFSISPINDKTTEGPTTFNVNLTIGSVSGINVATAGIVTVNDTSTTPPTYKLTPIATFINEGSSLILNVKTTNVPDGTVLYWDILNITTSNPRFSAISGSVNITSNASSFSISLLADNLTEGPTTFNVNLRIGSAAGTIVTTAGVITVNDTSTTTPTYKLTPLNIAVNEGSSLLLNIATTNIPNGTILYWSILNITTTNSRFSTTSGSVTVSNNIASFYINPIADTLTEGSTFFNVDLMTGSISGVIVTTSGMITVNDTSTTPPTYKIIPTANNVNEGSSLTLIITTTNVPNGTILYWDILNITTTNTRFPTVSNSITIINNTAFFNINPLADNLTEGPTTFNVNLRTINSSGLVMATAGIITINDTSNTPVPTYSLIPMLNNINEGSLLQLNIATTNVPDGTVLYWDILNITTTNARFSAISGSVNITGNASSFNISPIDDYTTEGPTTFNVNLRIISANGNIVTTSGIITINDTSIGAPSYKLIPSATSVNEGSALTINVLTTNIPNGSIFSWNINNITTTSSRFSTSTGTITVNNNMASFTVIPIADKLTEGATTFTVSLISFGDTVSTTVSTTTTLTINDTSVTPPLQYFLSLNVMGIFDNPSPLASGTLALSIGVPITFKVYLINGKAPYNINYFTAFDSGLLITTQSGTYRSTSGYQICGTTSLNYVIISGTPTGIGGKSTILETSDANGVSAQMSLMFYYIVR